MREQWYLLRTAIMFYTRIPVGNIPHGLDRLNRATRYLPLIGWLVGSCVAGVLYGLHFIAPWPVSIILGLVTGIWMTGAFHEDGFADMCDGFGGGWTKEKILLIMKDSRVGTYGMLGLLLLMLLKFYCLYTLTPPLAAIAVITAHALSRFTAVTIIYTQPYVRENEDSKAKPVSKGIKGWELLIAACFGLLPLLLAVVLLHQYLWLLALPAVWLARTYMTRLMRKWIGGYTGDCLGAIQQLSETVVYLCFCLVEWKYT